MPGRIHQNDAPALSLASDVSSNSKTFPVNQSIENVETPISYTISSGTSNEEIVTLVDKNTSASQFEGVVRGCDGTSAKPHASGEVLTHEATARDFVDKRVVQSQIIKPSKRLVAFDDFDRSQRLLGGDDAPSGQTWQDPTGDHWKIESGRAFADSNIRRPAYLPYTPTQDQYFVDGLVYNAGNRGQGLIISYQDKDNFIVGYVRSNPGLQIVSAGSSSTLKEAGYSFRVPFSGTHELRVGINKKETQLYVESGFGGMRYDYSKSTDAQNIISNSIGVGMSESKSTDSDPVFERFFVYEPVSRNAI